MKKERAQELVAAERARIEGALRDLTGDIQAMGSLQRQQTGEAGELGTDLETEGVDMAIVDSLREQLAAVQRAEERIDDGTFGRSIESGASIADDRLEAEPLAERTIEEQRAVEGIGR